MTTTDTDFAALCAAIDAGDLCALPALADRLEELGDERVTGLRIALAERYEPCVSYRDENPDVPCPGWLNEAGVTGTITRDFLSPDVFGRLPLAQSSYYNAACAFYSLYSQAYLALAEALK